MGFKERLTEKIKMAGLTQKEFAEKKAGVSVKTLQGWISKKTNPRIDDFIAIAQALDCSVEELWLGEKPLLKTEDRKLLQIAREYSSLLEDLKELDDTSFQTFATSIHAVAEESRARKKNDRRIITVDFKTRRPIIIE